MDGNVDPWGWPELLYRLAEYFRWEPQHRGKTVKEFQSTIRRLEVPLNYLFLLLLRWSAPQTIRTLIEPFGLSADQMLGELRLMPREDTAFAQPDVHLESGLARIYIEVKIKSALDAIQVQKYLLLHAVMDAREKKQPFLLVPTPGELGRSWKPRGRVIGDVQSFCMERRKNRRSVTWLSAPVGRCLLSTRRDTRQ